MSAFIQELLAHALADLAVQVFEHLSVHGYAFYNLWWWFVHHMPTFCNLMV